MVVWARNLYPIVTGSCRKQMQKVKKKRLQCSSSYYKKTHYQGTMVFIEISSAMAPNYIILIPFALYTTVYKII